MEPATAMPDLDRAMLMFEARAAALGSNSVTLDRDGINWAKPLHEPCRYKGAKGGRSSGKSHFFAEELVARSAANPDLRAVCIREYQKSLEYSAKSVIEAKIRELGVSHLFEVQASRIKRRGGIGVIIFQGMQAHTADSIKSLEAFSIAWVEEAQNISRRSLDLLTPTIRMPGSELWFSWNPDQEDDPVEQLLVAPCTADEDGVLRADDIVVVHSTYLDNPWTSEVTKRDAERRRRNDPDGYAHIWLGKYNKRSDAIVLAGCYCIEEFEPSGSWFGPYFGSDLGFSGDPTVGVRFWLGDSRLWIEYDTGGEFGTEGLRWDNDTTVEMFLSRLPGVEHHTMRSDASRPETINELNKRGLKVKGAKKWAGSVEDGIQWLRSFGGANGEPGIVIHPRCKRMADEARLWAYKTDRLTGDPLPVLKPGNDHGWDAVRYGGAPIIKRLPRGRVSRSVMQSRSSIEKTAATVRHGRISPARHSKKRNGKGNGNGHGAPGSVIRLPAAQLTKRNGNGSK